MNARTLLFVAIGAAVLPGCLVTRPKASGVTAEGERYGVAVQRSFMRPTDAAAAFDAARDTAHVRCVTRVESMQLGAYWLRLTVYGNE